jgi:hypothetical protein
VSTEQKSPRIHKITDSVRVEVGDQFVSVRKDGQLVFHRLDSQSPTRTITPEQLDQMIRDVFSSAMSTMKDGRFTLTASEVLAQQINQFFNGPEESQASAKHEKAEDGLACVCGFRPDYPQATDKGKQSAVRDHINLSVWQENQK